MIEALAYPPAHPHDPSAALGIETLQTHISHLFLSRDRVYKLRKAVVLPFLSFGSLEERNADCLREVSLNRRLAPDVYLGVAAIRRAAGGEWQVGPPAESLDAASDQPGGNEHCVVMRRLPKGRDALGLLGRGELTRDHVDAVAAMLASFHASHSLGAPAPFDAAAWLARIRGVVSKTFIAARSSGCDRLDPALLEQCEKGMRALFEARSQAFEARRLEGRVVDGHGDLHLDHVFFEDATGPPIAIDCIEFDDDLRQVDVAAELAFFAMDLLYRDRSDLAEQFLRRYASICDDFGLYAVVDYHILHRALVRAAVAGIAAMETEIEPEKRRRAAASAAAHLELVRTHLERPPRPLLVLMCGRVGSGKSTLAEVAADVLQAVVISSDRTRKRLAGYAPEQRVGAGPGEGIYTDENTKTVYAALLARAEPVLGSGRPAVLDASFSKAELRDGARRWAAEHGYRVLLLEAECDDATALERLARRERDATRVSDAGVDFHAESTRRFEAPLEWPDRDHLVVRTERSGWRDELSAVLEHWINHAE